MEKTHLNWNCPQNLQNFAAETVATILMRKAIPTELTKYADTDTHDTVNDLCSYSIDKIIVAQSPDTQEQHKLLMRNMKSVKEWWMNNPWLRSSNSMTRKLVQESASKILNKMDKYLVSPLIKLTLQLCFTKEAGIFNSNYTKIHLEVPKKYCGAAFNEFLDYLGPFEIERFYNINMVYGSPEPLIVILRNSPQLKVIHLRYNSSDFVLKNIGKYCSELETFVVDECFGRLLVTEKYLYKTFYCGLEKEEVKCKLDRMEPVTISFPKLKHLDLGKNSDLSEFFSHLRILYPNLESISCNSCNFAAEFLTKIVNTESVIPFHIVDICLTSQCILSLDKNTTWSILPSIRHITVLLECIPYQQLQEFSLKVNEFLSSLSFASLTIQVPFDSMDDETIEATFAPLFISIGCSIKALQFDIMRVCDISLLFKLINLCTDLELLTIRLSKDAALYEPYRKKVKLHLLSNVKYLSISYEERNAVHFFFDVAEHILLACQNMISLELMIPCKSSYWIIKTLTLNRVNNKVQSLTLQLFDTPTLQATFYIVFMDLFPQLRSLVLIDLPSSIYVDIINQRRMYNLEITSGRSSRVSYRGIASKYPMF